MPCAEVIDKLDIVDQLLVLLADGAGLSYILCYVYLVCRLYHHHWITENLDIPVVFITKVLFYELLQSAAVLAQQHSSYYISVICSAYYQEWHIPHLIVFAFIFPADRHVHRIALDCEELWEQRWIQALVLNAYSGIPPVCRRSISCYIIVIQLLHSFPLCRSICRDLYVFTKVRPHREVDVAIFWSIWSALRAKLRAYHTNKRKAIQSSNTRHIGDYSLAKTLIIHRISHIHKQPSDTADLLVAKRNWLVKLLHCHSNVKW